MSDEEEEDELMVRRRGFCVVLLLSTIFSSCPSSVEELLPLEITGFADDGSTFVCVIISLSDDDVEDEDEVIVRELFPLAWLQRQDEWTATAHSTTFASRGYGD